jgi:hypothetical protein
MFSSLLGFIYVSYVTQNELIRAEYFRNLINSLETLGE